MTIPGEMVQRRKAAWDLDALRAYVRQVGSDDLLQNIDSLARIVEIFGYHFQTARDSMKELVDFEEPLALENIKLMMRISEKQREFCLETLACEANVIACVQVSRNMCDIFSHLVNSIVLNNKFSERSCEVQKVFEAMPSSPLQKMLGQLLGSSAYRYVLAFCNTTKHRRVLLRRFVLSGDEGVVGLMFPQFEYREVTYASRWHRDILADALEVRNALVGCGRALNRQCGL